MKSAVSVYAAFLGLFLGIGIFSQEAFAQKTTHAPVPVKVPNAIDIAKAEILGLHLYMDYKEAYAALKSAIPNLADANNECSSSGPCVKFNFARPVSCQYTPGKSYVSGMSIMVEKYELDLQFQEAYPFDPSRPETLVRIAYHPHGLATDQDRTAFRDQVVGKYGPSQSHYGGILSWYQMGMPIRNKAGVVTGYDGTNMHPFINLITGDIMTPSFLTISDGDAIFKRELDEFQKTRTTSLPPL